MPFEEMKIKGAWVHTPSVFPDERGSFHEVFKLSAIEEQLGRSFQVKQVNQSTSSKGVIRGIHFTDSVEGQAKYVSCVAGSLWDVIVDVRKDSETYGQWDAVLLSAENRKSVLISEGLGHAFLSLEDGTVANYLCTSEFNPALDLTIDALDKDLKINFSVLLNAFTDGPKAIIRSDKDLNGLTFHDWSQYGG
jgi:dTDP-4-dehydrorhamnose 3,5-epimerase